MIVELVLSSTVQFIPFKKRIILIPKELFISDLYSINEMSADQERRLEKIENRLNAIDKRLKDFDDRIKKLEDTNQKIQSLRV